MWGWGFWYIFNSNYDYLAIEDDVIIERKSADHNYLKIQTRHVNHHTRKQQNGKGHMMFRRNAVRHK